jgi:hypothetical protein
VRRWTLIVLILIFLLMVVVAVYQIQLAGRRAELEDRPSPRPTAS